MTRREIPAIYKISNLEIIKLIKKAKSNVLNDYSKWYTLIEEEFARRGAPNNTDRTVRAKLLAGRIRVMFQQAAKVGKSMGFIQHSMNSVQKSMNSVTKAVNSVQQSMDSNHQLMDATQQSTALTHSMNSIKQSMDSVQQSMEFIQQSIDFIEQLTALREVKNAQTGTTNTFRARPRVKPGRRREQWSKSYRSSNCTSR
ncbi:hypothetical protein AA313_de0208234 [Arthrobotrys entomopaga]|nr:hypothetical protein AA313_de0208234 [Arthrobotrys entomopaga]